MTTYRGSAGSSGQWMISDARLPKAHPTAPGTPNSRPRTGERPDAGRIWVTPLKLGMERNASRRAKYATPHNNAIRMAPRNAFFLAEESSWGVALFEGNAKNIFKPIVRAQMPEALRAASCAFPIVRKRVPKYASFLIAENRRPARAVVSTFVPEYTSFVPNLPALSTNPALQGIIEPKQPEVMVRKHV